MRVTDIDVSGLRYDNQSAQHEGHVLMELWPSKSGPPMHVHFVCHSHKKHDSPPSLVMQDLVEDALRQAHRMPGYRRGERKLEVDRSATGQVRYSSARA